MITFSRHTLLYNNRYCISSGAEMVFVLDTNRNKLNPCHPAKARLLLKQGKAAVFRMYPFTIDYRYLVKKLHKANGYSYSYCLINQKLKVQFF